MQISLTGIKPTGIPHLGNYIGAIKPALSLVNNYDAYYFLADYHSLNSEKDSKNIQESSYKVAAAWLACGLNPDKVTFYKQSQVPQITELAIILTNFTAKGLINRAHSYKDKIEKNSANNLAPDEGINMGLYFYPVLMAADILAFSTNVVPVGKDQKQHVEIAAEIARVFNNTYNKETLIIPKALINNADLLIGTDGRKMSKSYNNVIPIFESGKKLRKTIMKIVTNSQAVEEAKDPENCNVFALYKFFSTKDEQDALAKRYLNGGLAWSQAKELLFEAINKTISPFRDNFNEIIQDKEMIDKVLLEGSKKAIDKAENLLSKIRKLVGVRS